MLGCEFVASNVVLMFVESLEEIVVQRKIKAFQAQILSSLNISLCYEMQRNAKQCQVMLSNAEECQIVSLKLLKLFL